MTMLSRRQVLLGAGAGLLASQAVAREPLPHRAGELVWRCTSAYPASLNIIHGGAHGIAKRVHQLTEGMFHIQVYAPGELAAPADALSVVSAGAFELTHTSAYYYVGLNDAYAFATAVPFGMNTRQFLAWYYQAGGRDVLQNMFNERNVVHLLAGGTGAQMGGWYRQPVETVADLRGLKIRMSGLAGKLFKAMGALPQQIPGGDIYPSLERGTIDAAEWIGPFDDEKLGFYRIAPYYYYPGFWEGSAMIGMFVNQKAWDSLKPSFKAALEVACNEATQNMIAQYDANNAAALARLASFGAKLKPFSKEIMQEARRTSFTLYRQMAASNPTFAAVAKPYFAFLRQQRDWFKFAELHYDADNLYGDMMDL